MTQTHDNARLGIAGAITILAMALPAFAQVPVTSAPPAAFRPHATAKVAPTAMLLAPTAPGVRIALPEPTDAERAVLKAKNAPTPLGATRPKSGLAIAFPRNVPRDSQAI